jgi:NDP-sugar pyrophosphorylase family protein
MKASDLFTLPDSLSAFAAAFTAEMAPWEWVGAIKAALAELDLDSLPERHRQYPAGLAVTGPVFIHETCKLPAHGTVDGPVYIGPRCELRPGVFIRGNVIAGRNCVLGNSCEFKNSLLMDGVQVPHYSYVGDSALGNGAHLGAGAILSNLRFDQRPISVKTPSGHVPTGMRKLGGLLGESAELGCNAVLQPGAVLSKRAIVVTGLVFSGYLEPNTMAYARGETKRVERRGYVRGRDR